MPLIQACISEKGMGKTNMALVVYNVLYSEDETLSVLINTNNAEQQ